MKREGNMKRKQGNKKRKQENLEIWKKTGKIESINENKQITPTPRHRKIQEARERQRGGNISIRICVLILCGHTGSYGTHSLYNCMINNDSVCIFKYIAYGNTPTPFLLPHKLLVAEHGLSF